MAIQTTKRNLAYLSFIFESYEGMATLSTLNAQSGLAQLTFFGHFTKDITGLLHALQREGAIASFYPAAATTTELGWDKDATIHAGAI